MDSMNVKIHTIQFIESNIIAFILSMSFIISVAKVHTFWEEINKLIEIKAIFCLKNAFVLER